MIRHRQGLVCAAFILLAACAAEPPAEEPLPLPPPPPPPRPPLVRPTTPGPALPETDALPGSPGSRAPESGTEAPAPAEAMPAAPAWRVARDGVLGCADPSSLRLLRQGADGNPRVLAETRAAGGCRTTFRVNSWTVEAQDGGLVRMRLVNGPPLTLWFAREDVVAP
ncbi:hypothetical protein GWK16_02530 [Roseomonas sp. JC162]|uniref:Uncharacterized protein n=1 Tax=Neoroseomonas marina TaxID=1232220 RepID=A0A848E7F6_9PROT|nr:hypothetical protein [Neoroseomonas marina]NMJ40102.1 hypothetical protein [Neoroseomonas marina]